MLARNQGLLRGEKATLTRHDLEVGDKDEGEIRFRAEFFRRPPVMFFEIRQVIRNLEIDTFGKTVAVLRGEPTQCLKSRQTLPGFSCAQALVQVLNVNVKRGIAVVYLQQRAYALGSWLSYFRASSVHAIPATVSVMWRIRGQRRRHLCVPPRICPHSSLIHPRAKLPSWC